MFRFLTPVAIAIFSSLSLTATAQYGDVEYYMPCRSQLRAGSTWTEVFVDRSKPGRHQPPMVNSKRCDISFQRNTDSARLQISFCHVKPQPTAVLHIDSVFSRQIGMHIVEFSRIAQNGRRLFDLSIRTKGCEHPWGLLIRENELPVLEDLLGTLSFEVVRD